MLRLNYQIIVSNSALEAIGMIRRDSTQFDLVVTDLTMPEMNGLELARQLRHIRADLPVVLMSGFMTDFNQEQVKAAGVCEILEKPVAPVVLAVAVQRALAGS